MIFLNLFADCFWLLSALIEYACFDLLYSAFNDEHEANDRQMLQLLAHTESLKVEPSDDEEEALKKYSKYYERDTQSNTADNGNGSGYRLKTDLKCETVFDAVSTNHIVPLTRIDRSMPSKE